MAAPDPRAHFVALAGGVPGWRDPAACAELFDLCLAAAPDAVLVEVGSFFGRSAVVMAGACATAGSGRVHCVDPFDVSGDDFSVPHYRKILADAGPGTLRDHFDATMRTAGVAPWVVVHPQAAVAAAVDWMRPIDVLLLDADHSAEGGEDTFQAWSHRLRPGGTLVLDNCPDVEIGVPGHDGNVRVRQRHVHPPHYDRIRNRGLTLFARRAAS
ncbi:MAG: class I SAM-dependent methyltransferase [Candidatus Nanopelagicales bacterium]